MNKYDRQIIVKRYTKRFQKYGVDIKTLASGSRDRQVLRFKIFSEIGNLDGHSVLDIGCGFGDFYQYFKDQSIKIKYTGIDVCPSFIKVCRQRFPEASFFVKDFQNDSIRGKYDYIVASQVFNNRLKIGNNERMMHRVIKKAFQICNVAVAIDMMTSYVDYREEHLYYYKPEKIFQFCKTLTKRVILRHDYPLFEFMICLYKDFNGWRKKK